MNALENEIKNLKDNHERVIKDAEEAAKKNDQEISPLMKILYDEIVESNIEILQDPNVVEKFKSLADKFGDDTSKTIVDLFAVTMTLSSFRAIMFYDEHLTKELDKSFKFIENNLNINRADIKGCKGAIDVFRNRLEEINSKLVTSEIANMAKKVDK